MTDFRELLDPGDPILSAIENLEKAAELKGRQLMWESFLPLVSDCRRDLAAAGGDLDKGLAALDRLFVRLTQWADAESASLRVLTLKEGASAGSA